MNRQAKHVDMCINVQEGNNNVWRHVSSVTTLDKPYRDKCAKCRKNRLLEYCALTVNGLWGDVCKDCGHELLNEFFEKLKRENKQFSMG